MTNQQIIDAMRSGVRFRLIPHNFARSGSTKGVRNLHIGAELIHDLDKRHCGLQLVTMERDGLIESHEDPVTTICEWVLPGEKAVWEEA